MLGAGAAAPDGEGESAPETSGSDTGDATAGEEAEEPATA
jgi:hypothetical protein